MKDYIEISTGYKNTTNNRMELLSVISALELIKKPSNIHIYSDSRYVVNPIKQGWIYNWIRYDWLRVDKQPVKNADLWKRFYKLMQKHSIQITWVKGHSTDKYNKRCDQLANSAAKADIQLEDITFG